MSEKGIPKSQQEHFALFLIQDVAIASKMYGLSITEYPYLLLELTIFNKLKSFLGILRLKLNDHRLLRAVGLFV